MERRKILPNWIFPAALKTKYIDSMAPQLIIPGPTSPRSQDVREKRIEAMGVLRSTSDRIIGTARVIGGLSVVSIGLLGAGDLIPTSESRYAEIWLLWSASIFFAIATNAATIGASMLTTFANDEDFEREWFATRRAYFWTLVCLLLAGSAVFLTALAVE